MGPENQIIEKPTVTEFRKLTHVYSNLQKQIPDSSPEKHCILTKLLEAQFWLKFFLDIQEQEESNPVKIRLADKNEKEVLNGHPAS